MEAPRKPLFPQPSWHLFLSPESSPTAAPAEVRSPTTFTSDPAIPSRWNAARPANRRSGGLLESPDEAFDCVDREHRVWVLIGERAQDIDISTFSPQPRLSRRSRRARWLLAKHSRQSNRCAQRRSPTGTLTAPNPRDRLVAKPRVSRWPRRRTNAILCDMRSCGARQVLELNTTKTHGISRARRSTSHGTIVAFAVVLRRTWIYWCGQ